MNHAVDGPRAANRKPAHSALECRRGVSFDQQVKVVALDAVVQHAKALR
jgi:hypothetical protein